MERKNFAVLCAAVLCFWLFALALGTAEGVGLRAVMHPEERAVSADIEETAEGILLPAAAAAPQLDLNCRAAILIEQGSGRVLYEKNADERVPIASITKVMTLLLAFEAVHDGRLTMETPVPVSEHAYHMGGSQIWLEPGEHFTLDEMIKAICVSSANDAAVAVAELVGGSEPAFVEQMNARAASLGMEQTSFRNACGLDAEGHLSTARDVAAMSRTILNTCPEVLHYTGIWTDTLRGGATQLVNTNKLLRRYEGITGLKTGTTGGAGICISASATRNGLSLIAVILGAPSSADRFDAATTLLDYGFGAAAKTRGTAAPDHGQRQRGGQRPAGLLGPAGDGAGREGERGIPAYRIDPARGAGSPGGAGPDAGQSRGLSGRSTSGRARSACCRRCAEDDCPGCHRPAVAEPHRRGMTENCALPVKNGQRGQRMAWTFV